jgi:hypothetical protein
MGSLAISGARKSLFECTKCHGAISGHYKGTISQTLLALERQELVVKQKRVGRGVSVALTPKAQALLMQDPQTAVVKSIEELNDKPTRRFTRTLSRLLASEIKRTSEPSFGNCVSCRHLQIGNDDALHCLKFAEALRDTDLSKICVAHTEV